MKTVAMLLAAALAFPALAAPTGEEVEVTSGVVTGLKCALEARATGISRVAVAAPTADPSLS